MTPLPRDLGYGVTLAVMARAPVAGKCKTRLIPVLGPLGAARLHQAMLEDTLAALGGVPAARRVVLATPEDDGVARLRALTPPGWEVLPQRPGDLGQRLMAALTELSDAQAPVAFVGSDSPTLPTNLFAHAFSQFDHRSGVVVGPSEDGGYYLIGLRATHSALFRAIPWSTSAVLATTRARARQEGLALLELPTSYDIDDELGLAKLAREPLHRAPRSVATLQAFFGAWET